MQQRTRGVDALSAVGAGRQHRIARRRVGAQVALRFLVRRPELFTIPKASSPEHAAQNARAGDIRLTEAEIEEIDRAFPLGRRPSVLPTL